MLFFSRGEKRAHDPHQFCGLPLVWNLVSFFFWYQSYTLRRNVMSTQKLSYRRLRTSRNEQYISAMICNAEDLEDEILLRIFSLLARHSFFALPRTANETLSLFLFDDAILHRTQYINESHQNYITNQLLFFSKSLSRWNSKLNNDINSISSNYSSSSGHAGVTLLSWKLAGAAIFLFFVCVSIAELISHWFIAVCYHASESCKNKIN